MTKPEGYTRKAGSYSATAGGQTRRAAAVPSGGSAADAPPEANVSTFTRATGPVPTGKVDKALAQDRNLIQPVRGPLVPLTTERKTTEVQKIWTPAGKPKEYAFHHDYTPGNNNPRGIIKSGSTIAAVETSPGSGKYNLVNRYMVGNNRQWHGNGEKDIVKNVTYKQAAATAQRILNSGRYAFDDAGQLFKK